MAQRISRAKATVRASADDATNRAACVSVVLALGARGGNDDAADTTTPPSSSVPASTDETSASPRPSPESTEPESTEPESTDIAPTEPAPTDSADDSVATSPPERFRSDVPMRAGVTYEVTERIGPTHLGFTAPADGTVGYAIRGILGTAMDATGVDTLVTVIDLDEPLAVKDPVVDFQQFTGSGDQQNLLEAVAPDYLAWFSKRPGVTVGATVDTEFAGVPVRSLTYQVGTVPGAFPYALGEPRSCLAWLFLPAGVIHSGADGDTGTLYELTVRGQRLLVDVTDRQGTAALAETIEFLDP